MTVPAAEAGDAPGLGGRDESSAPDDVLERARAGDGAALGEIWARFAPAVAAFARMRGATDVDEITNDAFLAAFQALPGFTGGIADFRGLLFTITRRRVIDELRRRSRRVDAVPWSPFTDPRTTEAAEQTVLEQAGLADLHTRLARLTVDQRDVVMLRLVADLSLEEVAIVLGKRVGTVKSLQRRAIDTLRRTWSPDEPRPPDPGVVSPLLPRTSHPPRKGTSP